MWIVLLNFILWSFLIGSHQTWRIPETLPLFGTFRVYPYTRSVRNSVALITYCCILGLVESCRPDHGYTHDRWVLSCRPLCSYHAQSFSTELIKTIAVMFTTLKALAEKRLKITAFSNEAGSSGKRSWKKVDWQKLPLLCTQQNYSVLIGRDQYIKPKL